MSPRNLSNILLRVAQKSYLLHGRFIVVGDDDHYNFRIGTNDEIFDYLASKIEDLHLSASSQKGGT